MTGQNRAQEAATRLRAFNLAIGLVHAAQGVVILALSNEFALPVTGTFLQGPPGTEPAAPEVLFDVPFGPAVAAFVFLAAADHLLVSAPGISGWYVRNLGRARNYARWVEYSVSATLMIVLIAMLTGISSFAAITAIAGVNASMILFGLLMEHYEQPERTNWLPFLFGSLAGAVPWIAIAVQIWSPGVQSDVPDFVVWIFVSLFLFFNAFAVNMVLQYQRIGPWRDYVFGEYAYIVLSLGAKSALAWQVFAGTLAA